MSSLCLLYDVSHLFVPPVFSLQACVFQRATDSPYSPARQVGVVFWSPQGSGGPSDAASRSPRVKGENSENRAFWSAREDPPALFCMLEFGQGVTRGCTGGENRWEGQRNDRKRLVQVRTNDKQSLQAVCATFAGMLTLDATKSKYCNSLFSFLYWQLVGVWAPHSLRWQDYRSAAARVCAARRSSLNWMLMVS